MNVGLVGLAVLMGAVTYPWRAVPLLAPGIERLPPLVLAYLRLVGPAVLAALAATNTLIATDANGKASFHVGIEYEKDLRDPIPGVAESIGFIRGTLAAMRDR